MLGNILLVFTMLCLVGLISITSTPMPGGDRGVGYAFVMMVCCAGFFVCSGLLAWNMGATHCFDWLGEQRGWLVFLGWLAFAFGTMASAVFKTEWHDGELPQFLRWLSQAQAAIWLPLLMLVPAFWLINFGKNAAAIPDFIQIPIKTGFLIGVLILTGLVFGYFRATAMQRKAIEEYNQERTDSFTENQLKWIAEQKPTDPVVNMLSMSGRFNNAKMRNAAIEKIKSHPDWEAELIRLLSETEWDTKVYHFIDGNKVEHPELFVEPIKISIRRVAGEIENSIKGANDLQPGHFEHYSLERLFRAMDEQFMLPGADYRPAVLELRKALDTPKPERFAKVKLNITPMVDDWLKKHP